MSVINNAYLLTLDDIIILTVSGAPSIKIVMESLRTVSITLINPVLQYASLSGIDLDEILLGAGIDPIHLKKTKRISIEAMDKIYRQAILLTGDDYLGLHAGELFAPASAHIVGHLIMNCRTIQEVLQKLIEYHEILSEGVSININQERSDRLIIELDVLHPDSTLTRHHVEYIFSGCINLGRYISGEQLKPAEIRFQHKAPADISEHQRIFQSPLLFGQASNAAVFDLDIREIPIQQANEDLFRMFEEQARQLLNEIRSQSPYTKKVRSLLAATIQENLPTIESVARALSLGARSLQRKLKNENTTFSAIFNEVFQQRAVTYLMNSELSITEISYVLGFSEPSAFHRTFKRWTGLTPNAYRRRSRAKE